MRSKVKGLLDYLLAANEDLSLEKRLFFSAVLFSLLTTIIATIIGTILVLPQHLVITGYSLLAVLGLMYYFIRIRKIIEPFIVLFVILCVGANGAIFIFGGGLNGQNVIILSITFILSLIITTGKRRVFILFTYLALTLILYLVQLFRPDYITHFHSEHERWIDGLTTTLYSTVILYLIIQYLLKNYNDEKKKAEESERNLQILNKTLETRIEERTLELLESNLKFQTLLNSAAEGIFGMDLNGSFTFVNQSCLKILGYKNDDQLLGENAHNTIHHSDPDGNYLDISDCRICKSLRKKTGTHASDEFLLKKDGTAIPVEFWSYPVVINNEVQGAVVTFFDITERKKAEEAIQTARFEAELANNAKTEFLANVSHEFRTPLNVLIGFTDLLETAEPQYRKEYAESIKSNGRRLLTMVNDILELIRAEKAEIELDYDYLETYRFFVEFEKVFSSSILKKGINFKTEIAKDLPALLFTDVNRLRLVVSNLLDNAIKFTDKGEVILKISQKTTRASAKQDKTDLIIEVRDTGKGISEDYQKKLYEAFSQAEKKTILSGLGIGLSLTHRIVSKMNGTISVSSHMGKGTRFIVTLRNVAFKNGHQATPKYETKLEVPGKELISKEKILDLKGLIAELDGTYMDTCTTFETRQPIGEVKNFGQSLARLGADHNCSLVAAYGKKLEESASNFDIDGMLNLIRKYREIVDILKY